MADNVPFNSLDPLGPEFGDINRPILDEKGLAPFEGEVYKDPKINFPSPDKYFPVFAGPQNLNRPNRSINQDVVRTNAVNPSIPRRPYSPNRNKSLHGYLDAMMQANQNKNNFGKIFSYNAGPDGNAFYKRYAAYGQEKFDQIGFSPLRDNEANFNARTTRWDDFSRMMSYSFVPLLTSGFVSGPKSLAKMLKGDFTSADLEDARLYEEAAAIGQSTKGGVFGFVNNATMNFGYTAGIILEAIAEEAAGALLAAPTGGASLFAATANNAMKASKIGKSLFNGFKAVKNTLSEVNTFTGARRFWEAASSSKTLTSVARGLNPLENTMDAFKAIRQADNFTDLALLSKTAGGFYRDVRNINMALSEARLEAGMVENHIYDQLYMKAFQAKGEVPTNEELAAIEKQAKDASYDTLMKNAGLIYASNAITFNNITGPKGGLRNFIKGTTEDVYRMSSKQGAKNFGSIGKVVYDRSAKAFTIQKDNFIQYAKNWYKQPVYKSLKSTVGYFKANFTEGIQENLQEVIAGANEKYYMDSYKSPALSAQMYSRGSMDMINKTKNDYYKEELGKQISGQGAETFASGFFMGALAGPLNNAVPFLSTGYNRMFDKEAFNKWKTEQTAIATNLVTELNGMDLKTFMSDKNLNLGAQDLISKIKQRGSKKEALDAETEAYVSQVVLMRQSGTTDLIKEKLKSFSQATDEEFADAFGIEKEQVEKYRGRVDMAVERLDRVNNLYTKYQRKYPNPVSDSDLADKSAPDYEEKAEFQKAWNINLHNMVFFNEVYDNAKQRREQIKNKYSNNPNFKSLGSNEKSLLFAPERLGEEITILKQDIQLEKEGSNRPEVVKKLEQKLGLYEDFKSNHLKFDQFFNRAEYSSAIQEILTKELGREATAEEINAKFTELYGDIDDKEIGAYIIGDLKKSHDNFLKTLAIQNDDTIFDETTNEAFESLIDYYKLGHEAKSITKYINLMDDPESFKDLVRRNQTWIKNFNTKKVKYFEDLIKNEMGKVRDNAFLNTLADNGYYLNEEDMVNYLGDKNIPPSEIYNYITKEVYPINSEKYKEIYAEFFSKRADLKAQQNAKKTNIVKNSYEKKIQDLRDLMEQEIANLPTNQVKVLGEAITMKNKTISAKEIAAQLNNEEYVEAGYEDAVEPMVFYKDADGQLLYDSPEGEAVDFADIKTKFTEATKFSFDAVPDAERVAEITKRYEDQIAEVQKAYTEDLEVIEDEEMYEEVTQDTDLSTPDLIEFRNGLYSTFIEEYLPTLSEDEQMAISEDETLEDIKFEEWYKKPENKKYFDEYNNKNRPEKSPDNITFTFEGKDLNTKDASLEELIKYRDILNTSIENLEDMSDPDDDERLRLLKVDLKNINSIIQKRQFAKFSPVVKEGVKKIQKLLNAQKGVEERYLLTEDDPDTGLKAGEIAYRVNGKIHRRVTKALQQVLGKDYVYKGIAKVNSAFDLTIGKQGLNTDSIDDFISQLKGLLSTKAPGYDPLPGVNMGLLDDLKDQLKKLTGLSKEQIDIEKTKDKLLAQLDNKLKDLLKAQKDGNETRISNLTQQRQTIIDELKNLDAESKGTPTTDNEILVPNTTKDIVKNFFTENTYQDGRDAGNFVDDAKDYLETGVAPKFDPSKITQEAYDKLFDPSTGYLTQLKRKVDSGEFYLIGRDLVVYDSNIMRPDGSIDRIAGEIDLLLATDDGIMIVDIKSGESNKWFNFNKLSKEGKPIYSKREEYTLQQGAYATMLEKMINAPVAGIALLPIERISDKDTNLIVDAGKPESKDVYSNLEYEKDKDGNPVKNAMNETVFKSTGKAYSNFFIPLYRDSVKDKLDMLFPQSSAKVIPGLTSVGQNQFKIFKERLEQISDDNTPANRKAVEAIELEMGQFLSNNPIEVPEDLTALLNAKKAVFDRADLNTLITNTLKRYQGQADINSKKMADLTKRVSEVKIDMNFDGIDLSETSDFVNEQLDKDSDFKFRYEVHEKYFENKYGDATPGQISAINNLSSTGVITNAELNEFNNSEKSKEEASLLIHEAVKRIQYLVANTEDTAEAKSLKIYQKDIISLMFYTKNTTAINKFISTLNSVKESVEDDNLNNAVSELNVEILNLDSGLSSPYIKENAKKDLETKLADIQKIKDAITSLPNFIDAETEITIEAEEEEGVVEEFDFDFTAANNVQEGDVFHSKSGNFAKYTVSKVNKDNSVELKDENNNPIEVSMAELNDNYLTQDEILSMEPENITDNVTPAENDISQENLTAVDRFIDNKTQIIQVEEDATKKTLKQLDDELLENLDC